MRADYVLQVAAGLQGHNEFDEGHDAGVDALVGTESAAASSLVVAVEQPALEVMPVVGSSLLAFEIASYEASFLFLDRRFLIENSYEEPIHNLHPQSLEAEWAFGPRLA